MKIIRGLSSKWSFARKIPVKTPLDPSSMLIAKLLVHQYVRKFYQWLDRVSIVDKDVGILNQVHFTT